ncbi:MAG TPA: right-handed parallel beta-helix repeat-containing protein, partial [Candidatus Binatia bacterium]
MSKEKVFLVAAIACLLNHGPSLNFDSDYAAAEPELRHRTLRVGPKESLSQPSMAASIAQDGDVIEIDAGTYEADAVVWTQNNLILRGIGGRARLIAKGAHAEGKAIWVIKGNNTIVENIEFTGATVPLGNGAGIRQEGADLTVRNCYFHFNQNGILTAPNPKSDILVESSEFSNNGNGEGNTHNIYIGTVRSFTLRASYVHHARVGHNVKSRALTNYILYNRIMDEDT